MIVSDDTGFISYYNDNLMNQQRLEITGGVLASNRVGNLCGWVSIDNDDCDFGESRAVSQEKQGFLRKAPVYSHSAVVEDTRLVDDSFVGCEIGVVVKED